ncbi:MULTISPECIES: LysR family transcriptional regulator [unclassified Pseudomonas]|uniref:LysR family transcriptional regulator n=1 Tax=unclassified Pseudomonas TaxID=196821 RepID=UPI0021BAE46A|nr:MULTISPECIES: LysR family transcriptional regulator [unclassified Pseudomonas]MCT8166553.1 LysR family transcriptional regulator [Pseudomonas sp. HD6422]MCT8185399.1 LysR family transcriptional regulator [Pseudomonas sp. HD6421]
MKLHQLKVLITICESGSIQETARLLHLSQPALSKTIKELEASLGVPLLVRSNRGITTTEYGERLVRRARLMLEEARRAREEIAVLKGETGGTVSIGISPATPRTQMITAINQFIERNPEVRLRIHEMRPSKLMEGLREGQLDLVLSCQPASRYADGFQWTALYSQPTVLAVRCGHPLRSAHSLRQLRDQRWLLQEPLDSSRIGLMFTHYQLAPPQDLLECSAGIIFCELACSTDVISYWPLRMFDYMNRSGPVLEALTIEEEVPGLDISMVYRNRELITRPARLLADELEYVFTHPRTFDEGADPTKRKGLVSIGPA